MGIGIVNGTVSGGRGNGELESGSNELTWGGALGGVESGGEDAMSMGDTVGSGERSKRRAFTISFKPSQEV